MSAFAEFSTIPGNNPSAFGINIAENCPAGNLNDFARACVAAGKELNTLVTAIDVSSYMPKAGGAFTGDITRNGAGGYFYHVGSTQSKAPVYTQPSATALPSSPVEGTVVLQY